MKKKKAISAVLAASMLAAVILPGCGSDEKNGVTEIEILQYKPEAATYFDQVEEEFNATHDDIHLTISSPNDASTIMRTRFVREDYPDIIGIGGDINYSYYVDADILADVSDYPGLSDVKQRESSTTRICLRSTAGRSRNHGMSWSICAKRSSRRESCRSISDSVIHGPVWRRGTPLRLTLHRQIHVSRSMQARQHLRIITGKLRKNAYSL